MPTAPPKACGYPGCGKPVQGAYCERHRAAAEARRMQSRRSGDRQYNANRPESDRFYGTSQWRRLREQYLRQNPLCTACMKSGFVRAAKVADHVIPYRDRPDLGLEIGNLRALCAACHNRVGRRSEASRS